MTHPLLLTCDSKQKKSTLECILTDETASDVTRIFESDREKTPYLNQTGERTPYY